MFFPDRVLREAQVASAIDIGVQIPGRNSQFDETVKEIFAEPDLTPLGARDGELDVMFMYPGGGMRLSPNALIAGLLRSALLQMYYLRLQMDESTFVRTVLEGYEELRRAARGEQVRSHLVLGLADVTLKQGRQITTPWGIIRPAPQLEPDHNDIRAMRPPTTCILSEPRLLTIKLDRAAQPVVEMESDEVTPRSRVLLPLACALASPDTSEPAVPAVLWWSLLLPFQQGFGYHQPLIPPRFKPIVDITDRLDQLEEWARIIDGAHLPSIDIAARRIVSACSERIESSDTLIDAVMAWENLVGTSGEVTFRVTAALSRALEADRTKRKSFRQSLAKIYGMRSTIVHGGAVEPSKLNEAAKQAVDVAIRALRLCYKRGRDWLAMGSIDRADTLLLEE